MDDGRKNKQTHKGVLIAEKRIQELSIQDQRMTVLSEEEDSVMNVETDLQHMKKYCTFL